MELGELQQWEQEQDSATEALAQSSSITDCLLGGPGSRIQPCPSYGKVLGPGGSARSWELKHCRRHSSAFSHHVTCQILQMCWMPLAGVPAQPRGAPGATPAAQGPRCWLGGAGSTGAQPMDAICRSDSTERRKGNHPALLSPNTHDAGSRSNQPHKRRVPLIHLPAPQPRRTVTSPSPGGQARLCCQPKAGYLLQPPLSRSSRSCRTHGAVVRTTGGELSSSHLCLPAGWKQRTLPSSCSGTGKAWRVSPAPGGNLNPREGAWDFPQPRGAREGMLVLGGGWHEGGCCWSPTLALNNPVLSSLRACLAQSRVPPIPTALRMSPREGQQQQGSPGGAGGRSGVDRATFGVQCKRCGWAGHSSPSLQSGHFYLGSLTEHA